jgi:hypothetical protein
MIWIILHRLNSAGAKNTVATGLSSLGCEIKKGGTLYNEKKYFQSSTVNRIGRKFGVTVMRLRRFIRN